MLILDLVTLAKNVNFRSGNPGYLLGRPVVAVTKDTKVTNNVKNKTIISFVKVS